MYLLSVIFLLTGAAFGLPQVKVGNTTIVGTTSSNVDIFLGIPFAEPPLGNLRLEAPLLTTNLNVTTFNASSYGFSCPQPAQQISMDSMSEDCLTVNVFRPSKNSNERLPVMVWIYGGQFSSGSSVLYHGARLVTTSITRSTPVIYVSFNYRLGPLGFPTGSEAATKHILNLGLHDQIAALQWVQANIGRFGGDKSKVTLFGQSAGASSIGIYLLGSKIRNLARGGIMESPAAAPVFKPEIHEDYWKLFVSSIPSCASTINGTSTIDCLRKADASSIAQAVSRMPPAAFVPTIDGPGGFIPDLPSKVGLRAQFPLIVGSNKDEGTLFVPQNVATDEDVHNFFLSLFSPPIISPQQQSQDMDIVMKLYPDVPALGAPYGTGNNTFGLNGQYKRASAISGDLTIESYRRAVSQTISKAGHQVWGYHFVDPYAAVPGLPSSGLLGVTHGTEIPYVFGFLFEPAANQPSSQYLSKTIQDYWISFATRLDPNDGHGNKRPEWKSYTPRGQVLLELNGTTSRLIQDNFRSAGISFFTAHPAFTLR